MLRDSNGDVVFAFSEFFGKINSLQAETRALCMGLEICSAKGVMRVLVEVDSKVLWMIVTSGHAGPSSVRTIVRKIRSFNAIIHSIWHCFREANSVVDSLASFSFSIGFLRVFQSQSSLPKLSRGLV